MSAEALITIGITCFREGEWLRECWQSVLEQTDPRWDAVLVVDGGADDATRQVFSDLEHPRLRKFAFTENVGPYPVRNKAFELTETPYHFYLDADDRLVPNTVANILKTFSRHSDAGFVYGDMQVFGAFDLLIQAKHQVDADSFLKEQPIPGPACAYRKDAWEKIGGFAAELSHGNADYDFHIGLYEAGFRGIHCGELIYLYRAGNYGKVSSTYRLNYYKTHEIMIARHPRFFVDERRRRLFLGYAYRRTAIDNYLAGYFAEARRLSRLALASGIERDNIIGLVAFLSLFPAVFNRVVLISGRFFKSLLKKS